MMPHADTFLFLLVAIPFREVNITNLIAEKGNRAPGRALRTDPIGESIIIHSVILVIQTIEQTTIQERDLVGQIDKTLWIAEIVLISHQLIVVVIATGITKVTLRQFVAFGRNGAVEHGKNKF